MTPSESSSSAAFTPDLEPLPFPTEQRKAWPRKRRSQAALEREVERLSARVEQLDRERAAAQGFAAVAAHELLKPLVMTEAYVAMVSESLDERQHAAGLRDLETLGRAAARARLLIHALLHDARAAERSLRRQRVDLGEVVRHCLSLLGPELQARETRVDVDALPEVSGEEALLGGVFTNLLLNALKYSPRDSAAIRVRARRRERAWELSVESDGPTIPPAERQRIFQPFHRGTEERRANGSGLGLAICRSIVERHGGRIGVSAAGRSGNRFYFTLPDAEVTAS
jgi:two-component system, sensor histidine kinase and response regulator